MKVIAIVPFRGSNETLQWVLEGLAEQQLPVDVELEVRLGADGCELPELPADQPSTRFVGVALPQQGAASVRNALLAEADGDTVVFFNADTRPDPDCIARHLSRLGQLPPDAMLLGAAPWQADEDPTRPTLMTALLNETPMVFFYDRLKVAEPHDYRSAWTLNLSMRMTTWRNGPAFDPLIRPCYYEDLAMAYDRLGPDGLGVWFDGSNRVVHRHPTSFDQYLDREELLGLMAPVVAHRRPDMFAHLFGTTETPSLADAFRQWVDMDRHMHRYIYQRMQEWVDLPQTMLPDGPDRSRMLRCLYQMHIPLKRLAFRLGFLHGLERVDDARWTDRRPQGLWRRFLAIDRHESPMSDTTASKTPGRQISRESMSCPS
jgi:glycosyltransferase involved in cell wall biosynthesis